MDMDRSERRGFHALPLLGRQKELLGVLLVGSSQREVVILERRILLARLGVVGHGIVLRLLLSWWGAARVTRPVQKLAEGAREVAAGNWSARVDVRGRDEIGQLATRVQSDDRAVEPSSASGWCRPSAWRRGANWRAGWRTS